MLGGKDISSFKGQAHQKWEPGENKNTNKQKVTAIKYEELNPPKATACIFNLPFFLPFVLKFENMSERKKMLSAVKDIRLKHRCKPLTCL